MVDELRVQAWVTIGFVALGGVFFGMEFGWKIGVGVFCLVFAHVRALYTSGNL